MAAPHALQVGTPKNIFVEIQDCTLGTNADVEISVLNYPARSKQLGRTVVALNGSNSCQAFGQILVTPTQSHTNLWHYTKMLLGTKMNSFSRPKVVFITLI